MNLYIHIYLYFYVVIIVVDIIVVVEEDRCEGQTRQWDLHQGRDKRGQNSKVKDTFFLYQTASHLWPLTSLHFVIHTRSIWTRLSSYVLPFLPSMHVKEIFHPWNLLDSFVVIFNKKILIESSSNGWKRWKASAQMSVLNTSRTSRSVLIDLDWSKYTYVQG